MTQSFDEVTLRPPDPRQDFVWVDALTIAFHPTADRIGERLRLEPGVEAVDISRTAPLFAEPGSHDARPLADRCVSRRPVTLRRRGRGFAVEAPPDGVDVLLDGAPVRERTVVAADLLDDGVVLEISQRVVLVLHRVPATDPSLPDLGLVGENPAIDELRRNILRVADLPVPVLIRGETGSGKELVASALHSQSDRARRPFVSLNMAAVPPSTAASDLFGHVKGAYTHAVGDAPGYFARAEGGTLFLDEIGATPLEVQTLLLRALDAGEIQPVGASVPRRVDVRLLAATDADLEAASADSSFSAALLHRLESFQLAVPPLRARRDDIGRLLLHFLRRELETVGEIARLTPPPDEPTYLPSSLVAEMVRFDWPGNVRQLRNVVRQLVIQHRGGPPVSPDERLAQLLGPAKAAPAESRDQGDEPASAKPDLLTDDAIVDALRSCDWQMNKAAARLGVARSTLYERVNDIERVRKARDLAQDEIESCLSDCEGNVADAARKLEVSSQALRRRMKTLGLS